MPDDSAFVKAFEHEAGIFEVGASQVLWYRPKVQRRATGGDKAGTHRRGTKKPPPRKRRGRVARGKFATGLRCPAALAQAAQAVGHATGQQQ